MRAHRASWRGGLGTPGPPVSPCQPGAGRHAHALPRFPNVRPTRLHLPLPRRGAEGWAGVQAVTASC